ncbi:MAG: Gfo/Idh/MocA family oxidoreductase [Bacteroidales bacterium]
MFSKFNRRDFLRKTAATGLTLGLGTRAFPFINNRFDENDIKIGVIGLDTSHAVAFTKMINDPDNVTMRGYSVVSAYPYGSRTIESSYSRIPGYIEDMKGIGVELADSLDNLLDRVDVVLLETNDGNLHLDQALEIFKAGKPVFIDKPVAGSLKDAIAIYKAAGEYDVPVFSSSSLRWAKNNYKLRNGELIGKITGADTYSPASIEPSHPDLFWYGVHGVENLFTVMGTGCKEVVRVHRSGTDIVAGTWEDGRIGTFRGLRTGRTGYGGTAFGEDGIQEIGPYEGYRPLVEEIIKFFKTAVPPVSKEETIEIFAFMEAADESKRRGGQPVQMEEVLESAGEGIR